MKLKRYTDSKFHKKIVKTLKDDLASEYEISNYYEKELPVILYVLENTQFQLAFPAADDTQYQLKTVKLDDIKIVKDEKEQKKYLKAMISYKINEYLTQEGIDYVLKDFKSASKTNIHMLSNFRKMLSTSLKDGKTEACKRLTANENEMIAKEIEQTRNSNFKIEFVSKNKIKE